GLWRFGFSAGSDRRFCLVWLNQPSRSGRRWLIRLQGDCGLLSFGGLVVADQKRITRSSEGDFCEHRAVVARLDLEGRRGSFLRERLLFDRRCGDGATAVENG